MANGYTRIAEALGDDSSTTISFTGIPSTYDHLILRISARSNANANFNSYSIQFNQDGNNNYYGGYIYFETSVNGGSSSASSTLTAGGVFYLCGSTSTSNTFSASELTIFNYKNTSYKKTIGTLTGAPNSGGTSGISYAGGVWNNTAALNRIDITSSSGYFFSGSTFRLYGISNT